MSIIDSHCHYNLSPLYEEWSEQHRQAQAHGVTQSLVVGTSLETSHRAIQLAEQQPQFWAAVGVHPLEYLDQLHSTADIPPIVSQVKVALEKMLQTAQAQGSLHTKLRAMGETGLDYFHQHTDLIAALQRQLFVLQIELAQRFELPLIIHVRDRQTPAEPTPDNAYWDTLALLEQHWSPGKPFVLHCVSGPPEYIQRAVALGAYIGVAGNVTYPNAQAIRTLITQVPSDRVLLETDAPYLPPQQWRGQTCQPWMIEETAKFLGENNLFSQAELSANALKFFK